MTSQIATSPVTREYSPGQSPGASVERPTPLISWPRRAAKRPNDPPRKPELPVIRTLMVSSRENYKCGLVSDPDPCNAEQMPREIAPTRRAIDQNEGSDGLQPGSKLSGVVSRCPERNSGSTRGAPKSSVLRSRHD